MKKYLLFSVGSLIFSLLLSKGLDIYFNMPVGDTFSGIATFCVIVATFYTYEDQKQEKYRLDIEAQKKITITKQRDSAKLVVMQIDRADSVIKDANKLGCISSSLPKFIGESEWERNKHILVDRLSSTDLDFINRYFMACEQLEEARNIAVKCAAEQFNEKARCVQRTLSTKAFSLIEKPEENNNVLDSMNVFSNNFYYNYTKPSFGEFGMYTPDYQASFLDKVLKENNTEIMCTTAYKALREIAEMS